MFWKVVGFVLRIIYFKRFRQADRIGQAAKVFKEGKPLMALERLEEERGRLHPSIYPLFFTVRARVLDALRRLDEAAASYKTVLESDPNNRRADFELAVVEGRLFKFDAARARLDALLEKEDVDDGLQKDARDIRDLLERIADGRRRQEFRGRAEALSQRRVLEDEPLGLPANLALLDRWIASDREAALQAADDMALLVGEGLARDDAEWKIGLSLEESYIVRADGAVLNPFHLLQRRFTDKTTRLVQMVPGGWVVRH